LIDVASQALLVHNVVNDQTEGLQHDKCAGWCYSTHTCHLSYY